MILLEHHNVVVNVSSPPRAPMSVPDPGSLPPASPVCRSASLAAWETMPWKGRPPESLDITLGDFDGVTYRLLTPESKTEILLSMAMRCFKELATYGANEVLRREYGDYLQGSPEPGYDVTLKFDLEKLPPDEEAKRECHLPGFCWKAMPGGLRNALAAPFERAFNEQEAKKDDKDAQFPLMSVHYREEEAIYVRAHHDRVTVIFSTLFKEETDGIFAKVFLQVGEGAYPANRGTRRAALGNLFGLLCDRLQEFVDARRNIHNAPPVLYSNKEPPFELRNVNDLKLGENVGYITFGTTRSAVALSGAFLAKTRG
ncbi:MAG: Arp2/3 complex, 34 kd subunit p34-Arc-domain-containing protein, partial [Olpidium bornovanus]